MTENIGTDTFVRKDYFSTLIFSIKCADSVDLNMHLLQEIYAERENDSAGIKRSNFRELGGWHSQNFLHKKEEYRPLVNRISNACDKLCQNLAYHEDYHLSIGSMWSIINSPGCSNRAHVHPNCDWSGVYYVQTPENCGNIQFEDPVRARTMRPVNFSSSGKKPRGIWSKVNYTPVAGTMYIFPSWLTHSVDPNLSTLFGKNADRVIISFNLNQRKNVKGHDSDKKNVK